MTAPDLTTMLRDTLNAHPDWMGYDQHTYGCAGVDCAAEYGDPFDKDAAHRQHQAAALAATVRDWLGSDELAEAITPDVCVVQRMFWDIATDEAKNNASWATERALAALVQQIGDKQ